MIDSLASLQRVFGTNAWLILVLLILLLDIYVILRVVGSHKAFLVKLAWIALIIFLPVLGLIVYFFLGREAR